MDDDVDVEIPSGTFSDCSKYLFFEIPQISKTKVYFLFVFYGHVGPAVFLFHIIFTLGPRVLAE